MNNSVGTRRSNERSYRSIIRAKFGSRVWSFNKVKSLGEKLLLIEKIESCSEQIYDLCGDLDLELFVQMLVHHADEHTTRYFKRTLKLVNDREGVMKDEVDRCQSVDDVLKLFRQRSARFKTTTVCRLASLYMYILFGKTSREDALAWFDSWLVVDENACSHVDVLKSVVKKLEASRVVPRCVRIDIRQLIERFDPNVKVYDDQLKSWLEKPIPTQEDDDRLFDLIPPLTPDIDKTIPSSPTFTTPARGLNALSSIGVHFSDPADDIGSVGLPFSGVFHNSPQYLKEPLFINSDEFMHRSSSPLHLSDSPTTEDEPVHFDIGDKVYIEATYLLSLSTKGHLSTNALLYAGPFQVIGRISDALYVIDLPACFNCSSLLPTEALVAEEDYMIAQGTVCTINDPTGMENKQTTAGPGSNMYGSIAF